MEYKVNLALTIWDAEHKKFMGGSKEVTLPFPPYEGLVLSEREGWYRINQVTWSMAERCFYCKIEIEE
ncbi:MAG TPA: hypothetical protein VF268_07445, partial [Gammaproteobacteria bacterium]